MKPERTLVGSSTYGWQRTLPPKWKRTQGVSPVYKAYALCPFNRVTEQSLL